MAQDAAVPIETIRELARQIAEEEVKKFARSSFLNNASISGGAGLRVAPGGKVLVQHPDGKWLMMMGTYDGPSHSFDMPDGSKQPMALIYRADGTLALGMFDPDPSNGFQQFLALFDRNNNIVMSDDTDSGQGLARPYLPIPLYNVFFAAHPQTTSSTWVTLLRGTGYKQHPKLIVGIGTAADAGTTGQVRVMVNGTQFGAVQNVAAPQSFLWGPSAVDGAHESSLLVEIQAQRTGGTGNINLLPIYCYGLQS